MFRDPRYLLPLAILLGVIVVSAVLVANERAAAGSAAPGSEAEAAAVVDYYRSIDLNRLRDAAIEYGRRHGLLPTTGGLIQQVCATPQDAACALREVAEQLPAGDGRDPYWYQSDGSSYFLFISRANGEHDRSDCPPVLPPALVAVPIMCLRGGQ
jgi:hypothetical protein